MSVHETHRWTVEPYELGLRVCRGLHDKSAGCEWEYFHPGDLNVQVVATKVQRVLEAARAWRKAWPRDRRYADETCCALRDAIDALDAPVERPAPIDQRPWQVLKREGYAQIVGTGRTFNIEGGDYVAQAEKIAAALNAQERKP